MEEEIICNRHRDLADAVMNAVPTRRREGNRRRAQLTEDDGKARQQEPDKGMKPVWLSV